MLLAGCVGKIHEFYYDTSNFYLEKALGSSSWTLPLSHPYHLLTLLCFCAGIILCPLGYGAIYRSAAGQWRHTYHLGARFRNNQDNKVQGLSHLSLKRRRNQNLVTMKFNMINWTLDTTITLALFLVSSTSPLTLILYLTVMSCGTPIVYFMGIEENRQRARDYFRSNMRIFIRSSRVSPTQESNPSSGKKKRRQPVNQEIFVDTPF